MLLSSRWTHLSGAESDSHAKRIWLPERKKGAAQAAPLSSVRMISVADLRYGRGPDAACKIHFVLVCFLAAAVSCRLVDAAYSGFAYSHLWRPTVPLHWGSMSNSSF